MIDGSSPDIPTNVRAAVLAEVAADLQALPSAGVRRVAVDGVDGAGKTTFADELAGVLRADGASVVRASIDGFHHPAAIRHRRGRSSPEGFFRDSYDIAAITASLLEPLRHGAGDIVRRTYDWRTERPVAPVVERVTSGAILVFDGIFAHRDELVGYWDYSVWLDVPFAVSIPRGAARGYGDPDPAAAANARYVKGQLLYLRECEPLRRATVIVDNENLAEPRLYRGGGG